MMKLCVCVCVCVCVFVCVCVCECVYVSVCVLQKAQTYFDHVNFDFIIHKFQCRIEITAWCNINGGANC